MGLLNLVTNQNRQIYKEVLLGLVAEAGISIKIATAVIRDFRVKILEDSFPLSSYIGYFAKKGVSIRILTTPKACKSVFVAKVLEKPNVQVRTCARNHLKLVLVDGKKAYIGTANLTSSGLGSRSVNVRNFEVGLITEEKHLVSAVNRIFDDIWNWRYCSHCLYRDRANMKCGKKT